MPLGRWEGGLDEDHVHVEQGSFPGMVVAAFVAPFLLPATARFVATAAQLPGVRLGVITTTPAERRAAGAGAAPGRALAGGRRAGSAPDRRGGGRAVPPAGPGAAAGRGPGAAAGAAGPGARGAGPPWHGRRDRAQRAGQGPDEDGARRGRRAVRPAPAGHRTGRGAGVRRRGRLPAGRQAARRGRGAGHLPARRRRRAAQLARRAAAAGGRPRAAGGVPGRRGAHVRQRHDRRADHLGVHLRLPAAAARGTAQPVDTVDGAAAAGAVRPALRRDQGRSGRPRCARSACGTR